MSSPFRASHRRSRSHSSPFVSAGPAFGAQPPAKWDVEAWRRGKRARREPSSPSEDADMDSCNDESMLGSPLTLPTIPNNAWSSSAPSTPPLPSTSDAFQFFPSKTSPVIQRTRPVTATFTAHTPTARSSHLEGLAQLHSDAFSDLRKAVVDAGEGFVHRMREFEAHRTQAGPSRVSAGPSNPAASDRKGQKRGRKRPSPASSRRLVKNDNEEESDIEIRSSHASGPDNFLSWSPSKKRAVSLSALSDKCSGSQSQPYSLPYPIPLRNRERSSSPSACSNLISSDDEDDGVIVGAGRERVRQRDPPRSRYSVSSTKSSPPPLSFSFSSTSNNSSRASLLLGSSYQFVAPNSLSSSPSHFSVSAGPPVPFPRSSKRTEKAVAALSLAMANGAGSVSDYEALREAQGAFRMDNSEAGSLWD